MSNTIVSIQTVLDAFKSDKSDSTDFIRSEYVSADVAGKAKVRKVAQSAMFAAIAELDAESANRGRLFIESLKSGSSQKVEVDPKARYAEYVASVTMFAALVTSGDFVPEGMEIDETDKADVLANPAQTVAEFTKLASMDIVDKFRKVRGSSVIRRSVTDHLKEVFADLPVGTFLTNTQAANRTSEAYGTDHPSSGAVAAVRPAALPAGLVRIDHSEGQKAGIRKVA